MKAAQAAKAQAFQCGEVRFKRDWENYPNEWQPLWPAEKACNKLERPLKYYANTGECSCVFYNNEDCDGEPKIKTDECAFAGVTARPPILSYRCVSYKFNPVDD